MTAQEQQQIIEDLNAQEDVQDARSVEFLGESHVHIDFVNGDIGYIDREGTTRRIACRWFPEGEEG